jgi:tetratricopeptide (TPR) repeat protein
VTRRLLALAVVLALAADRASACITDSQTPPPAPVSPKDNPDLARAILGREPIPPDPAPMRKRLALLRAEPREGDVAWWNDVAGALLRLGEAADAAKLLESAAQKFPGDAAVRSNLGTAYHMLGRPVEAERELGYAVEIQPGAQGGVEAYHLDLVRYLAQDEEYRAKHVFLDEWSETFLKTEGATLVAPPKKRDGLERALLRLTEQSRSEPACFVMLGLAAQSRGDLPLAAAAYEKAMKLRSPQAEHLAELALALRRAIDLEKAQDKREVDDLIGLVCLGVAAFAILYYFVQRGRSRAGGAK